MTRYYILRIAVVALVLSLLVHVPVAQAAGPHVPNRAYHRAVVRQQHQQMKTFQRQQRQALRHQQASERRRLAADQHRRDHESARHQ